jgi:hypothetical protein
MIRLIEGLPDAVVGLELDDRFTGYTAGRAWHDAVLGLAHSRSFDRLLARPAIVHPGNRRLLKHMSRERDHLFTFLRRPELGVPATNWRAEQGIRPAVMIRKTWGGNATWIGAGTQERLMSVCRTARQQGVDVIEALTELQRQPQPGLPPGLTIRAPSQDRGG